MLKQYKKIPPPPLTVSIATLTSPHKYFQTLVVGLKYRAAKLLFFRDVYVCVCPFTFAIRPYCVMMNYEVALRIIDLQRVF